MTFVDIRGDLHQGTLQEAGCTLADTANFHERAFIVPVARPQGLVELRIESTLDSARDPQATQVRYRAVLDRAALKRLRDAIDRALGAADAGTAAETAGAPPA
jgi:hypothetical protein